MSLLKTEFYRIRHTAIPWLVAGAGLIAPVFIFLVFVVKSTEGTVDPAQNPWVFFQRFNLTVLSVFLVPFSVLITNSIVYNEHQSNTWKLLYTLPIPKWKLLAAKVNIILLFHGLIALIFLGSFYLLGFLLGVLRPDFGFGFFNPPFFEFLPLVRAMFISLLPTIGFQFFLSMNIKSYIPPAAIGFIGFMLSLFIVKRTVLAWGVPYAYPVFIGLMVGDPEIGNADVSQWGWFYSTEWIGFLAFSALTILTIGIEYRKNHYNALS